MSKKIHASFVAIADEISSQLSVALARVGPMRLPSRATSPLVDTLCRAVAGQQLSTKAAATIWGRVVESAEGRELASHIDTSPSDVLRQCGLSAAKTKAMKAIVVAEKNGLLAINELQQLHHSERARVLTSIWGVGKWTADMTNIFYFREADVWPANDITVLNMLTSLTSKRRNIQKTADRFAPYRSYLAMYMYRIADGEK